MASLNDTLTVGLILILLFGAVSLYLYTRVQQCEQKLNLVESILLDIKMSAELREYPELPAPVQGRNGDQDHDKGRRRGNSKDNNNNSNNSNNSEDALYASALEEAHLDAEVSALPPLPEESASGVEVAEAATVATKTEEIKAKSVPTVNYESMTLAELKAIGKQRSITGLSAMKRSQILEALRNADSKQTTVAGDLSSFLDLASPLDEEMETLAA
jgi:hypothetical protein